MGRLVHRPVASASSRTSGGRAHLLAHRRSLPPSVSPGLRRWCPAVYLLVLAWAGSAHGLLKLHEHEERLIGWGGETYDSLAASKLPTNGVTLAAQDRERGTWVEPISWYPRAFHLHNIMSPEASALHATPLSHLDVISSEALIELCLALLHFLTSA